MTLFGFPIDLFWIGVAGGLMVEVASFVGHYDRERHPAKYGKPGFYISKLILILSGGMLVKVYAVSAAPAALQIGASASAIVLALARKEEVPVGMGRPSESASAVAPPADSAG